MLVRSEGRFFFYLWGSAQAQGVLVSFGHLKFTHKDVRSTKIFCQRFLKMSISKNSFEILSH